MRLTSEQVTLIKTALDQVFPEWMQGELFLYGSRVDDQLKGGDIDLVLVIPDQALLNIQVPTSSQITVRLKQFIGDRKIDFTVLSQSATSAPFWQQALIKTVKL